MIGAKASCRGRRADHTIIDAIPSRTPSRHCSAVAAMASSASVVGFSSTAPIAWSITSRTFCGVSPLSLMSACRSTYRRVSAALATPRAISSM